MRRKNKRKKIFRKLMTFLAIGMILECSMLYFVNNHVLAKRTISGNIKFKEENYKNNDFNNSNEKFIDINSRAKNIKCSYRGDYVSYIEDNYLKIVNINSGEVKKVHIKERGKISYYRWIQNTSRIYICFKSKFKNSSEFYFYFYDANKDSLHKVRHQNKDIRIIEDKDVEISDVKISTLTGMFLIKTINLKGKNSLYKLDRMNNISKIKIKNNNIGTVGLLNNKDEVVYETLSNGEIYTIEKGKSKKIDLNSYKKFFLLGNDVDDNIYFGQREENKISKIYYKSMENLKEKYIDWNIFDLGVSVTKKDIYLIDKNNIYVNDSLNSSLIKINNNKKIRYKGILIGIYQDRVVSILNSKIYLFKL